MLAPGGRIAFAGEPSRLGDRLASIPKRTAIALARWIGPLGGAMVSLLLAAAVAGVLVWLALRDLKEQQ